MEKDKWIIDGIKSANLKGAHVKFEDQKFFTIEWKGRTFNGEILEDKSEDKQLKIKINHRVFEIKKIGELDELIASMGLDIPKIRKLKELAAPMPGRIVNIYIKEGDEVAPGDELLSLEAMKMENVLKAEGNGIVKAITIKANQVVDKGMVLIEFE